MDILIVFDRDNGREIYGKIHRIFLTNHTGDIPVKKEVISILRSIPDQNKLLKDVGSYLGRGSMLARDIKYNRTDYDLSIDTYNAVQYHYRFWYCSLG